MQARESLVIILVAALPSVANRVERSCSIKHMTVAAICKYQTCQVTASSILLVHVGYEFLVCDTDFASGAASLPCMHQHAANAGTSL